MPLKEGSTDKVIAANIQQLIKDGFSPRQAKAIAMNKAGKGKSNG